MADAETIMQQHERMREAKQPFTSLMQECADLLLPRQSNFQNMGQFQGNNLSPRIFDEYAQQALEQGISLFEGYVVPRGQVWQRFELDYPELNKSRNNRAWLEMKNTQLFALRNDPKSGFTGQVHESVASLMTFGMQSTWVDIRRDVRGHPLGLSYKSEFIGEIFVKEDYQGLINTIHHRFFLSAEKALAKWKDKAPECVQKAVAANRGTEKFEFIHVIEPNSLYDPERLDHLGKPWRGCYVSVTDTEIFEEGGYRVMPRIVSRFINAPNEEYGRCPAFTILPAIKATQQMMADLMVASELAARPPMGAHDDMLDETIRYAAHEITYGAIDARGQKKILPLIEGADMQWASQMLDKLHGFIDRAFYVDMLQIRNELKSHVTDQQLMQRDAEKGILLGPFANQEDEWFSVMLDRELDLMDQLGMMDDMPAEIHEAMMGGVGLKVVYDNGLNRAQQASGAAGYFQLLTQLTPLFQADPNNYKIFAAKYPFEKVLDALGPTNGVPASYEADEDARNASTQNAIQQQSSEQLLTALPQISKVANDLHQMQPANAA